MEPGGGRRWQPPPHDSAAKPHSIVGLGGHLGEHVVFGNGAATTATPCEAAMIEFFPKAAVARDPCFDLVSNRSLSQEDGARLLASVVHGLNNGGALPENEEGDE
ncbi:unnamed protein product [Lactuca saligna]|uniref:Uncharacterized protein n=1 Tax=Lactuca saligna TaxID=75948 RepID=A0AA36DYT0_LACSI|nr:unnamed protein product [Lactuca saligna]